jgi:hypothetical protein
MAGLLVVRTANWFITNVVKPKPRSGQEEIVLPDGDGRKLVIFGASGIILLYAVVILNIICQPRRVF